MIKLNIKIHPNTSQDHFIYQDDILEVWIKAPAVEGKANKYLLNYLSEILNIPKSLINIVRGSKSKFKLVEIEMDKELILKKLQEMT